MPPKKKKKGNVKKSKNTDEGDELEAKYRRTTFDVSVLKEHLALRRSVARHAQSSSDGLKSRMKGIEQELWQERVDMKDVIADLIRQYKTMQTSLEVKVDRLEEEVSGLKQKLGQCQKDLAKETKEHQQTKQDKDVMVAELQGKLNNMEIGYAKILHETLDTLLSQLTAKRLTWVNQSTTIHKKYKDLLHDFGLNPLDI